MATRSLNSQSEYLQKIAQLIAEAKFAPDADLSFWIGLETTVLGKAHEGSQPTQAASQLPGNAVATGATDLGAGLGMEAAGAGLAGAGAGMLAGAMPGGGAMPGAAAGTPGPGSPLPPSPGVRFSPDMMRRAMRGGGIQGG